MGEPSHDPAARPHRKRCRRFNEPGHVHALTFSCFRRQPFLSRDRSRSWAIEAIRLAQRRYPLHLWAYVIMPEHMHWLIWPAEAEYDISAVLKTFKQSVAKKAVGFVRRHAPEFLESMT